MSSILSLFYFFLLLMTLLINFTDRTNFTSYFNYFSLSFICQILLYGIIFLLRFFLTI